MKQLLGITRVQNRGIEKQLTRIADSLEKIIQLQYGYFMTKPEPLDSMDESSLSQQDDLLQSVEEFKDVAAGRPVGYLGEDEE